MSTAPVPATLVLLSDLDSFPTEAKVRFLGCVAQYNNETGTALLTHHYPVSPHQITARVNIDLVLEVVNSYVLQVGSWINVIGYICGRTLDPPLNAGVGETPVYSEVAIRAVMLWSAGDLKLKSYEDRLQERKDAHTTG